MKDTIGLKTRNLNYAEAWYKLNPEHWINGGEFERKAQEIGYKASNSSRRCRELYKEGKIDRKIENGSVWYRYRPVINF